MDLFVLRFNVPDNSFTVMSEQSHHFLRINQYSGNLMHLAQGHNLLKTVGNEPSTSRFRVECSSTLVMCYPYLYREKN